MAGSTAACHECGADATESCEACGRPTCQQSYAERDYFGLCECCLRGLETEGLPHTWPYPTRAQLPALRRGPQLPRPGPGDPAADTVHDVPGVAG